MIRKNNDTAIGNYHDVFLHFIYTHASIKTYLKL